MTGDRHGPTRLSNYEQIHTTIMQRLLRGAFVLSEDLSFEDLGDGSIAIIGTIICAGGIEIQVTKRLKILDGTGAGAVVQTVDYNYNVHLRGIGNIFRYDGPHPDHNQFHHVHRFDVLNSAREIAVEESSWPHLNEVIAEAEEWYAENYDALTRVRGGRSSA